MHSGTSTFDSRWLSNPDRRPLIMGILNVTPDSFSDGGQFIRSPDDTNAEPLGLPATPLDVASAVARARAMAAEGASIIDVGGESTRPGSTPVDPQEQLRRIVPVVRELATDARIIISIDTTHSTVAEAALDAGAHLINDISAGRNDPRMLSVVANRDVPIILMHMQGTPATMQVNPSYENVTREIAEFLQWRMEAAVAAGVDPQKILLDPGIGFGKTVAHNLEILRGLRAFRQLGRPLVIGASRKGFIGKITGETLVSGRRFGTAATIAWAIANGADIARVHDVTPMSQVVTMIEAIQGKWGL